MYRIPRGMGGNLLFNVRVSLLLLKRILVSDVLIVVTSHRYLRPAEAFIVFVGRRHGGGIGSTVVFSLTTQIDDIAPMVSFKSY